MNNEKCIPILSQAQEIHLALERLNLPSSNYNRQLIFELCHEASGIFQISLQVSSSINSNTEDLLQYIFQTEEQWQQQHTKTCFPKGFSLKSYYLSVPLSKCISPNPYDIWKLLLNTGLISSNQDDLPTQIKHNWNFILNNTLKCKLGISKQSQKWLRSLFHVSTNFHLPSLGCKLEPELFSSNSVHRQHQVDCKEVIQKIMYNMNTTKIQLDNNSKKNINWSDLVPQCEIMSLDVPKKKVDLKEQAITSVKASDRDLITCVSQPQYAYQKDTFCLTTRNTFSPILVSSSPPLIPEQVYSVISNIRSISTGVKLIDYDLKWQDSFDSLFINNTQKETPNSDCKKIPVPKLSRKKSKPILHQSFIKDNIRKIQMSHDVGPQKSSFTLNYKSAMDILESSLKNDISFLLQKDPNDSQTLNDHIYYSKKLRM